LLVEKFTLVVLNDEQRHGRTVCPVNSFGGPSVAQFIAAAIGKAWPHSGHKVFSQWLRTAGNDGGRMKVTIMGSGYVGLVTGTCLAQVGHQVVCFDVDSGRIERLNRGDMPIFEPGLGELAAAG